MLGRNKKSYIVLFWESHINKTLDGKWQRLHTKKIFDVSWHRIHIKKTFDCSRHRPHIGKTFGGLQHRLHTEKTFHEYGKDLTWRQHLIDHDTISM